MIIRKTIAYLVVMMLCLGVLPITSYTASSNRINKVLTVMEDEKLLGENAPQLIVVLSDPLEEGDIFYLELSGAKWLDIEHTGTLINANNSTYLELKRMTPKQLQVKVKGDGILPNTSLKIPMQIQMTDEKAIVTIKNNNTAVTSGSYLIAQSMSFLGELTVGDVPITTSGGIMADLWLNEPFSQAFSKAMANGAKGTIQIQLNSNAVSFDLSKSQMMLKGIKGFEGINGGREVVRQIDEQTLEVTLPDISKAKYTGSFILSGIMIHNTDKDSSLGTLTVTVQGDLLSTTTVDVLEVMDYANHLEAEVRTVRAGSKQRVTFTLEEKVEHSLVRTRPTYFSFESGVILEEAQSGKVAVTLNGVQVLCDAIIENNQVIGFKMSKLPEGSKSYTFTVDLVIPTTLAGKISIVAEGKSLIETLKIQVLEVIQPFVVDVSPFKVKVGVKDQIGGTITISETSKGTMTQGKSIIIQLEESAMKFTKAPSMTVTEGDIRLGEPIITAHRIEIPVIRRSNVASTLSITDFMITADQTVADGTYGAQIGGEALSEIANSSQLDPVWKGAFIYVGDAGNLPPSEPEDAIKPTTVKVCFTIGKTTYTVDNEIKNMDVAPFISNGRTLVPVKYVAEALGMSADRIFWNGQSKTVTIYGEEKIILKIGSMMMQVGAKTYHMSAAPNIKNGRTYVPVAEIARALNVRTEWEAKTKVVTFTTYR